MLKHIEEEPWNIYYYSQQLAAAQFKIHRYSANSLPGQREKFAVKILIDRLNRLALCQ